MFYENFIKYCEKFNTTPQAVCKAIGLSERTHTFWKNGHMPSPANISKIAHLFNITCQDLTGETASPNSKPKTTEFYKNFLALCKINNVSPSQVTESIGMTRMNASFWKRGSIPTYENLQKLANYFNISVQDLTGKHEPRPQINQTLAGQMQIEIAKTNLEELINQTSEIPEQYQYEVLQEIIKFTEFQLYKYDTRKDENPNASDT